MTIVLAILLILVAVTSRPTKFNENYLDKRNTNTIKGIFLIFVFIKHFISYKIQFQDNYIDNIGINFVNKMGQLIVTLFLFYSGYGVMESIKAKGENYIKNFPKKRILTTLINFGIAVIIYMFATGYLNTHVFSIKKLVLSIIGWDTFGNSNWYIFAILILYFITYLSAKAFKKREGQVISIFAGTILFTVIMSFYKETYWYNTAFCFVFGVAYSAYKDEIEEWLKGKEWLLLVYGVISFLILFKLKKNIVLYYIFSLVFTAIIILLTRKLKIKNPPLELIGRNLFPMYIFQRLPMILLSNNGYMVNNPYIFFVVCLGITIIITLIYNLVQRVFSYIKTKLNEKQSKGVN